MLICIALVPRLNIEAMLCLTDTHPPPHERDDPYLYGQTRALPLSSSTCSARTSPSTILRHRPPVRSPAPEGLHDVHLIFSKFRPKNQELTRLTREPDGDATIVVIGTTVHPIAPRTPHRL